MMYFRFQRYINVLRGHTVASVVEAVCYKPEGRGFGSG
jgi:hypothetical protein